MAKDLVVIPGARILASEIVRAEKALAALKEDPHAPRTLDVKILLHVHNEYPKHVTVGKDEEGNPIVKVANGPAEEKALLEAATPAPVAS